jgi:uncharacterized cofD-like protein
MREPFAKTDTKIAVIGGGTGSFAILSALKERTSQIAALVNMVDDGGSTGTLRDELGALPPGDVRQCLVALSKAPELRDLFNYRFDEGSFKGHAFGNIFLTALEKMTGSFTDGVDLASRLLNITGMVEPITETNTTLVVETTAGGIVRGESNIEGADFHGERPEVRLEPEAIASERALRAIKEADIVVIAPGNIYRSIAPVLATNGVGEALRSTKAFCVYVCNLVTMPGQTTGFKVHDFADEIERLAGGEFLDAVLFNTELPSDSLMARYAKTGELPVEYDQAKLRDAHYVAAGAALLAGTVWKNTNRSDPIAAQRTYIRHDSEGVTKALFELYEYRSEQANEIE